MLTLGTPPHTRHDERTINASGKCKTSIIIKDRSLKYEQADENDTLKQKYPVGSVIPREHAYVYDRQGLEGSPFTISSSPPATDGDNTATSFAYCLGVMMQQCFKCPFGVGENFFKKRYMVLPVINGAVWGSPVGWGGAVP